MTNISSCSKWEFVRFVVFFKKCKMNLKQVNNRIKSFYSTTIGARNFVVPPTQNHESNENT